MLPTLLRLLTNPTNGITPSPLTASTYITYNIYTHTHTHTHTYIQTYIHIISLSLSIYIHTCMHAYIHIISFLQIHLWEGDFGVCHDARCFEIKYFFLNTFLVTFWLQIHLWKGDFGVSHDARDFEFSDHAAGGGGRMRGRKG
jgi:hypothetical protein